MTMLRRQGFKHLAVERGLSPTKAIWFKMGLPIPSFMRRHSSEDRGWGARIRTWDGGTKTRCLTAWLRPSRARKECGQVAGGRRKHRQATQALQPARSAYGSPAEPAGT